MLNIQEVYEKYFTVVYRYLLSLSHNTHIAEELTQETFFKALKKVDDFRGECDLRVWLCQISKNTYYDYLKKNKKYVSEAQNELSEDLFGKSESWARVTYHRACKKIREELDDEDHL